MPAVTAPTSLTYLDVADFVVHTIGSVDEAVADGPDSRRLDVDLTPLTHFDSSAIAAMVALERRAAARNVELRFLNATPNLRKLATLYAVDSLLFGD